MDILVDIEASIDYPEYDTPEVTNEKILKATEDIKGKLDKLEKTFENGKILKDGLNLAIVRKTKCRKIISFKYNVK